jgi:hypothetical protein
MKSKSLTPVKKEHVYGHITCEIKGCPKKSEFRIVATGKYVCWKHQENGY